MVQMVHLHSLIYVYGLDNAVTLNMIHLHGLDEELTALNSAMGHL